MKDTAKKSPYFSKKELILWGISVCLIFISFFIFDRNGYLTLIASLIGATSLIFNAKGNPVGQLLMIVFSHTGPYYGGTNVVGFVDFRVATTNIQNFIMSFPIVHTPSLIRFDRV